MCFYGGLYKNAVETHLPHFGPVGENPNLKKNNQQ
jgi:hypothetical protein